MTKSSLRPFFHSILKRRCIFARVSATTHCNSKAACLLCAHHGSASPQVRRVLEKEAGMFRYLVIAFKHAQKDATVLPICAGVSTVMTAIQQVVVSYIYGTYKSHIYSNTKLGLTCNFWPVRTCAAYHIQGYLDSRWSSDVSVYGPSNTEAKSPNH